MNTEPLRARADAVPFWMHRIDLGRGVVTPAKDRWALPLSRLGLLERVDGLTVRGVGAWDGLFSFACERRGAAV